MRSVCVLNVVGLTPRMLGKNTPHLSALAKEGFSASIRGVIPAVTCTAQASLLTGLTPSAHGIVGNGWYFRELGETRFWIQSNQLVYGGKLYETARARAAQRGEKFSCAKLFWWFNQGAAVDYSITPKPFYGADGSKEFGISTTPATLGPQLEAALGAFPFPSFWGPKSGLPSSEWIAQASIDVLRRFSPTLTLVYLPHLDYDLQRFGPDSPQAIRALKEIDSLVGSIVEQAKSQGINLVVVSEYGISKVNNPIAINRVLREAGWLSVRPGPYGELLDPFFSRAFAVADHQIAHIYVRDPALIPAVKEKLSATPGIARVLNGEERPTIGLDHPNSGELIALAQPNSWFSYYYWLDNSKAPDFARTVDIHRKPGYDPCELFFDPQLHFPTLRAARRLLQKKLGFRYLMDLIPLDASLVHGSHGLAPIDPLDGPIFISDDSRDSSDSLAMTEIKEKILALLGLAAN